VQIFLQTRDKSILPKALLSLFYLSLFYVYPSIFFHKRVQTVLKIREKLILPNLQKYV
jgi:hypothetical protein